MVATIHPHVATPPVDDDDTAILYELVASQQLPCVNAAKTIKLQLLRPNQAKVYNGFVKRHRIAMLTAYWVSFLLRWATFFVSVSRGRWLAVISVFLQIPGTINVMLSFRIDILKILVSTYQFWHLFIITMTWLTASMLLFPDLRAVLLALIGIDFLNAALMDAFLRNLRQIVLVSWLSTLMLLGMVALLALDLIDHTNSSMSIMTVHGRTLTAKDIFMNATMTILILVLRIGYRKRASWKATKSRTQTTQCISYHHRIKLQGKPLQPVLDPSGIHQKQQQQYDTVNGNILQMRPAKVDVVIDARQAILCIKTISDGFAPLQRWQVVLLYSCGFIGFLSSMLATLPADKPQNYGKDSLFAVLGLLSVLFLGYVGTHLQRDLVRMLYSSFDYLFIMVQLVVVHICICDLLFWKWQQCCGVFCSLIWIAMIVSLDALTPIARAKLHFHIRYAGPVILLFIIMQILIASELLIWGKWNLQDRRFLYYQFANHKIEASVVPLMLSRLMSTFLWSWRLLWRIWNRSHTHELLILHGNVEFNSQYVAPKSNNSHLRTMMTKMVLMQFNQSVGESRAKAESGKCNPLEST